MNLTCEYGNNYSFKTPDYLEIHKVPLQYIPLDS